MREYALEELILGDILREQAARHRARTFLKLHEGELTYAEVNGMADRMAQGFAAHGVRRHDHVAVMLPNSADMLFVIFALARLGAVAVPINTAYMGDMLHHVLETSDATMLVVDEPLLDRAAAVLDERLAKLTAVVVRTADPGGAAPRELRRPALSLGALLEHGNEAPEVAVRHCDLQAIMYTSGTTGPSKGVMCPHAHVLTDALDSWRYLAYTPDETIYCPLPLFHAAALWDGMMVALLGGASIAIVERFSASRFWSDVRHFQADVAMGIFAMVPILLNQPPSPDDRNHTLRALYMGHSSHDEAFRARFGVRAVETYTSTEAGIGTGSPYGEWRPGSCGQANDATLEVKVVDEWDREVPPGEPGEIVVRPKRPFVMTTGYYNFWRATAETFRNLWFHTGDRVYRDEDGYFYFLGRIKDSIRRRGENISAFEVEQTINEHPAVLEAAAFGVPAELEEEEVKVAVVLRKGGGLDAEELTAFCEERLPAFMVPKFFEFVDELPRTPTGKVSKHELRERAARARAGNATTAKGPARG